MTRQWTIEELGRVHPFSDQRKAEGWQWMDLVEQGQGWAAVIPPVRNSRPPRDFDFELGILAAIVWVDSADRIRYEGPHPPVDVALAVILASKGLDSCEAMAAEVEREASEHVPAGSHEIADGWAGYGREALARVAAMLRRGTVKP